MPHILICPVCRIEVETIEHLFLLCNWVRIAWFGCPLSLMMNPSSGQNITFWIEDFLLVGSGDMEYGKAYIATMCLIWFVWKLRCKLIFEREIATPAAVIELT